MMDWAKEIRRPLEQLGERSDLDAFASTIVCACALGDVGLIGARVFPA